MNKKEIIRSWVETFNRGDAVALADFYHENAINHQVANSPVEGKSAIFAMFKSEFEAAEMLCIIEELYQDGDVVMLEWSDPLGLRGCGFFTFCGDKISFQRGYWDKLSFLKQNNLPLE